MSVYRIKELAKELKLGNTKNEIENIIEESIQKELIASEIIELYLEGEVRARRDNSLNNRIKRAKFPNKYYLCDLITHNYDDKIKEKINELETLQFINSNENVIMVGNPGVGKTHLATALGLEACNQGYNVLFMCAPSIVIELKEAYNESQLNRYKEKFKKYDLVIIDELGYISFDKTGSELLFNLISERNNKGSLIITSNLTFDKWKDVFNDPILTGALVDRLVYKSSVMNMVGESHRIKNAVK